MTGAAGAAPGLPMTPDTPWSYTCGQCGACCKDKDFIVTPYDVARLAQGLGQSTAQVAAQHLDPGRPALKVDQDGWCVFFRPGQGCTVHHSRPAVCRLYPLGRTVTAQGAVVFEEAEPHPDTQGHYGRVGPLSDYLNAQGLPPYLDALAEVGDFLDDAFACAGRAGLTEHLDAAVQAFWTGEGGPAPLQVIAPGLLAEPTGDPEHDARAHLAALRPLCGLDLPPDQQAALLSSPAGRLAAGWLVIATAALAVGVGMAPGFSRPPPA